MTVRALVLLAAAALAGCPLPQPLPDYPPGTITPPRILSATTTFPDLSIIPVPANCPDDLRYDLDASIFYLDNVSVDARWFVDYRRDQPSRYAVQNTETTVPPPLPTELERQVPPFAFRPYGYPPPPELGLTGADFRSPGVVHVVELVVSNGFDPNPDAPEPNRTPGVTVDGARFEIQSHRWTFVNVAGLPCPAAAP